MLDITAKLASKLTESDTKERCGIVLSDGEVIEFENRHAEPEKGYCISAADHGQYEDVLVATWHTHPAQTANLSQEDYNGFLQWPHLRHYIIGIDGVRIFVVVDGMVIEDTSC